MKSRSMMKPLVKSLLFTAFTGLATAVLAVSIAQTQVGATDSYKARFSDASGLRSGDSVRVAGVQIGRVNHVSVTDRRVALVTFSVEHGRSVPLTATATIKYLNLVGQRYVELDRGAGGTGELKPGSTIPLDRTRPALDLTQLFNGFRPLMQALSPGDVNKLADSLVKVFQGEGPTMETLLTTVGSLTKTIANRDQVIGEVVTNLNAVLSDLNGRSGRLVDLVTTLRKLVSGLASDRQAIGDAVSALDDLTNSTAGLLGEGRQPLRADIDKLGALSKNLADNSGTVERFLRMLPTKTATLTRLGSYGSWMNLYMCEARLSGVSYKQYDDSHRPPPTGIPLTEARCRG
ncbi:MCE family protein [Actinomadura rupiterrae]|uniref:MCE family protein n=1 Tax=Actinomadura rupiterrae TaxID=559627 RepID=UPI0020A51F90|nr:MCE family protein [Actinomadura rupiterrae]MCP2339123.1 phospholipid/cholesterol/gamma-HCH transport system substrate-binding protein [Actinomadura rupiterrae]